MLVVPSFICSSSINPVKDYTDKTSEKSTTKEKTPRETQKLVRMQQVCAKGTTTRNNYLSTKPKPTKKTNEGGTSNPME